MVGMFPTIVGTYSTHEPAQEHAELLRKHDIQALVIPFADGQQWAVVVPVAQYPQAERLTRAARLTGELRNP